MTIMAIQFKVGANMLELLAPIFEASRRKFWALKHILCARTPLAGRMKLCQSVVGGAALWCVAAFNPEHQALVNVNRMMYQMVVYMLRVRRKNDGPPVPEREMEHNLATKILGLPGPRG